MPSPVPSKPGFLKHIRVPLDEDTWNGQRRRHLVAAIRATQRYLFDCQITASAGTELISTSQTAADITSGEGTVVVVDIVSSIVNSAR